MFYERRNMKELSLNECKHIYGGGLSIWSILGISSIVTFIGGLIDGIARPYKCR